MPLVLSGTDGVSGVDGTASNPSYEGTDSNTGIFYPAADTVAIGTGGTERLRVDSAGNAGLGVTPAAWDATLTGTRALQLGALGAYVLGTGSGWSSIPHVYVGNNGYWGSGSWRYTSSNLASQYYQFGGQHVWLNAASGTAGNAITFTQAMTLDASGNLGIGTTSPTCRVEGVAPAGDNITALFRSGDATAANNAGGGFRSISSATAASRVAQMWLDADGANFSGGDYFFIQKNGNSGTVNFNQFSNAAMTFSTNDTERARITSGGYFKASNAGTYVNSTGTFHELRQTATGAEIIVASNTSANPYGYYVEFTGADPNNTTNTVFGAYFFNGSTYTTIYKINSNGTVTARSDAKWKKNIETARDGYVEDLAKLRVVKYNWYNHEDGTPKELGLIAQEVEQVFPGLVQTEEEVKNEIRTREIPAVLDDEGNEVEPARTEEYTERVPNGEYSKSIKFSVLPFMLLKAIQEQQTMIDEMKAEIAALKGNA